MIGSTDKVHKKHGFNTAGPGHDMDTLVKHFRMSHRSVIFDMPPHPLTPHRNKEVLYKLNNLSTHEWIVQLWFYNSFEVTFACISTFK